MSRKARTIIRKHRRRSKAALRNPAAVRSHTRPRPHGRKIRVKHGHLGK